MLTDLFTQMTSQNHYAAQSLTAQVFELVFEERPAVQWAPWFT